ncbi:hypothetical protein Mapa_005318 [Marchantia paleacea]|nr:hypothetical protein Mapa_005318 [Marchantia paleacea]
MFSAGHDNFSYTDRKLPLLRSGDYQVYNLQIPTMAHQEWIAMNFDFFSSRRVRYKLFLKEKKIYTNKIYIARPVDFSL